MKDEKVITEFNNLLENCSEQDLNFMVAHEVSREEKIQILKERDAEAKKNLLENFTITV